MCIDNNCETDFRYDVLNFFDILLFESDDFSTHDERDRFSMISELLNLTAYDFLPFF